MRDLTRAILRFTAELAILTAERILEHLDAERPLHDEPLPGHALPPDDTSFTGYSLSGDGCADSSLLAWGAAHLDAPEPPR